ncbi:MAG TPA: hypothetical protein VGK73_39745 [Polyangiaceae bacterium]
MNHDGNAHDSARSPDCTRTRLIEGALAVVDTCACGMFHVHIGALTLRFTKEAVAEIAVTLEHAVEAHARATSSGPHPALRSLHPRGQA